MTEKYQGYTNYATWNVALWADNDYGIYQAKSEWLEKRKRPVTTQAKDPGTRYRDIDWSDLAETWETDRLEIRKYNS